MSGPNTGMSDIVERLRDLATYPQPSGRKQIMDEAADEIERLRAIRDELVIALGGLILHVQERDHYEECFGEAAEMKIARKAYQAAAVIIKPPLGNDRQKE